MLGFASLTSLVGSLLRGTLLYVSAPFLTELTLDQSLLTDFFDARVRSSVPDAEWLRFERLPRKLSFRTIRSSRRVSVVRCSGSLRFAVAVVLGALVVGMTAAVVVAWILPFFFGVGLLLSRTDFRPGIQGSRPVLREFYNFSLPLTLGDVGTQFQNKSMYSWSGSFSPRVPSVSTAFRPYWCRSSDCRSSDST